MQYVSAVHDGAAAHVWGLAPRRVVLMVHSGSLSLGHQANATGLEQARAAWPRRLPLPANRILPILLDEHTTPRRARYLTALSNAANFALGNRYFLVLMLRAALAATVGEVRSRLLYDAPHNLLWPAEDGTVLHRKGATPAGGPDGLALPWGEPVIVPGSMGVPSYLLRGLGNQQALASACHGAGRGVPRSVAARRDVVEAWRRDLKQEAPWAYKGSVRW